MSQDQKFVCVYICPEMYQINTVEIPQPTHIPHVKILNAYIQVSIAKIWYLLRTRKLWRRFCWLVTFIPPLQVSLRRWVGRTRSHPQHWLCMETLVQMLRPMEGTLGCARFAEFFTFSTWTFINCSSKRQEWHDSTMKILCKMNEHLLYKNW